MIKDLMSFLNYEIEINKPTRVQLKENLQKQEFLKLIIDEYYRANELKEKVEKITDLKVEGINFYDYLHISKIDRFTSHKKWIEELETLTNSFIAILKKDDVKYNFYKIENYLKKDRIPEFTYKAVLTKVYKKRILEEKEQRILYKFLIETNFFSAIMVFKNFMGTISALYIKNKPYLQKNEKEKYKKLILMNTIKLSSSKNIKEFKNKTRDLKSSLEITEKQNENLKKELEDKIENVEDATIYNFLKEINSFKYSEIINHVYSANDKLIELKSKNERLPLEFRFMEIPIKFLKRYFDDIGVKEYGSFQNIQKVDETVIEIYDYIGTPFEDDETKEVKLIKKGWKFKDKIISKPTVKELVQEEEE
jgi:hypothetical protein